MICPYCGKEAIWCENKEVYGINYGKSYMCYFCKPCNAYVGCHTNSKTPLGTMANSELREWRKKAHQVFDPLWEQRHMRRRYLYQKMSEYFGKQIHIGEANIEECKRIIEWCKTEVKE